MLYQQQWEFLKKSAQLGKVPHALLFYGPDTGRQKTLALDFIKLLNCQDEKCSEAIEKNVHPDLFIVEPQGKEIQIAQIRELHVHLSLRSYSAPFKSVIIERAHFLNEAAQSAFLKLLEEPKGKTIFILITEYPEMLLPTILSRVEKLRFYSPLRPYQKEEIKELLKINQADLAQRFLYAKKLAEDPQSLNEILGIWLKYFRELLISRLRPAGFGGQARDYSVTKLQKILKTIQTTNFLISTTNVNPRLALEILMLEL